MSKNALFAPNTARPARVEVPHAEAGIGFALEERLTCLTSRLHARGQRVTSERLAVLRVLLESGCHPSAEQVASEVLKHQPSMSMSTVYSTLNLLAEMGELLEIVTYGGKRYDARQSTPHPHLICTRCHEVSDLDVPVSMPHQLMARARVEQQGYRFVYCCIRVFGVCPRCQEQQRAAAAAGGDEPIAGHVPTVGGVSDTESLAASVESQATPQ